MERRPLYLWRCRSASPIAADQIPSPSESTMRTAFYAEVTAAVAGLVLLWAGLSTLPPTGWIYNALPGEDIWSAQAALLALAGGALAVYYTRRANLRSMPLPPIPGMTARAGGIFAFVLAIPASLMLFWWIAARDTQLPVGPVGWALGAFALGTLAWGSVAAGAIWSGREAEREQDLREARPEKPVGL